MLKRLFLPQRYLQTHHEIIAPTHNSSGRREWIIGRCLCHYHLFDLSDVPSHRWETVLTLKIRQWSPFSQYQCFITWQGTYAQVWVWEQAPYQEALTQQAVKPSITLPESVLYARPKTEGARLLACLTGVEGQVWQNGILIGSRWWSNPPTLLEWQRFQRAHALPLSHQIPTVENPPLLEKTWAKTHQLFSSTLLRQERVWFVLAGGLFIGLISWQGVNIWRWQQGLTTLKTEIDTLMGQASPILEARTATLADQQRLTQLLALNKQPSQLTLMAQVAETLPQKVKLVDWSYQTGRLKFTIEATAIDPRFYVEAFQALPNFHEVQTEAGRTANQLVINTQIEAIPASTVAPVPEERKTNP
ncbi:hypothetical protein BegalDRAFT_2655 [Beggiatoa alba B18LD]|uniref:Uncharacterized protein n=1 Tax=Beggiatoa alba B18LD TaxID=395493 RepID=I3CIQ3_9GAMM|nr:hypothetical protein [Beggiatoa alba]EIJ43496.1 hypothetical protein BegalDRAFT_2655 [Beggiatoa alba B18LD]